MISLSDVTVVRGASRVVEGLDIRIGPGGIFWIVGPNGAGKSSLLRVLVGLDRPRKGEIHRDQSGPPRTLFFHSEMAIPPAATVGAWDRLVSRIGSPDGGSRTALWPDAGPRRRVARLSTGERKRLLLDALLRQPGPVVLDEPFEHLSPGAKLELGRLLTERAADHVVVVATNQATERAARDGGLRLEGGEATLLAPTGRERDGRP